MGPINNQNYYVKSVCFYEYKKNPGRFPNLFLIKY